MKKEKGKKRQSRKNLVDAIGEENVSAKRLTKKEKKVLARCLQDQLKKSEGSLEEHQQIIEKLQTHLRTCSDVDDKSQVEADLAKAVRQRDRLQFMIRESQLALARIEQGLYGVCENPDCGLPIGIKRLKANPTARFCIECQQQLEVRISRNNPFQKRHYVLI